MEEKNKKINEIDFAKKKLGYDEKSFSMVSYEFDVSKEITNWLWKWKLLVDK